MRCLLTRDVYEALGEKKLSAYGVSEYDLRYHGEIAIDLAKHKKPEIEALAELLRPLTKEKPIRKGSKAALAACEFFLKTLGGEKADARSLEAFEVLLRKEFIEAGKRNEAEGRPAGVRVYRRADEKGTWDSYHVSRCRYKPKEKQRGGYAIPAKIELELIFRENGYNRSIGRTLHWEDVMGKGVEEGLAGIGLLLETPELRAQYEERTQKFLDWCGKVGKQMQAVGEGTDNCDGNGKGRRSHDDNSWWRNRTNTIQLDKGGDPSRVIVDVFTEDKEGRAEPAAVDRLYWYNAMNKFEDDEAVLANAETEEAQAVPMPEVPIHPSMVVFDLKRHLRLRVDVGQLTEHQYNPRLGDALILPENSRNLVEMLLAHKGQFRDIVKGKSGGAIIMCAGQPGTGKTLTAEVYAEVMARPLYTVQASQLGTDPEELEDELLKTFARAARWNAIMLIDEADVYVHARGDDLQQNAIVGVFLRVLEYYKGVLFMTTNRSDLVDDAIASRCIARIDYKAPAKSDQARIWQVLSSSAGIEIAPEVITQVVERYPDLTGRDVKNLLKLAKLVSDSRECDITLDVIRFVKQFKPTMSTGHEMKDDGEVRLPEVGHKLNEADIQPAASAEEKPAEGSVDWRAVAAQVFDDGAPHAASEAKEAVAKVAPAVHPNAVTVVINQLTKAGQLQRLSSGLYRKEVGATH